MLTESKTTALLTAEAMRGAESQAIADGISAWEMMQQAGEAVAESVLRLFEISPVCVMCGPGNNGGDGYVAASFLRQAGWEVQVGTLVPPEQLTGNARRAYENWNGLTIPLSELVIDSDTVYIDALFGTGLNRPLDGEAADTMQRLAAARARVVAVDILSGVNADSGRFSNVLPNAAATITFGAKKPGHLLLPGAGLAGFVASVDIGIMPYVNAVAEPLGLQENRVENWFSSMRWPAVTDHKYSRGALVVLGGAESMTGASRLAATAALRAGAGAVTVACSSQTLPLYASTLMAVMTRVISDSGALQDLFEETKQTALLLGPGLGVQENTRSRVAMALATAKPTVLDADALTAFADDPQALFSEVRGEVILTPHAGELQRLFAKTPLDLSQPKWQVAREAARMSRCVVVYKGFDTVIAAPDGRVAINNNGTPVLATAGSGDVLAGIIGSLCAQGMPAFEAACAGVSMHGEAGQRSSVGMIADDLPSLLPGILNDLLQM